MVPGPTAQMRLQTLDLVVGPQSKATEPQTMSAQRFNRPVHVFVGLGFPHAVSSVQEARQVLDEWTGRHSPKYTATVALCQSALARMEDVEAARVAFEAFALAHGILAPDAIELVVARAAEEWMKADDVRSEVFADS